MKAELTRELARYNCSMCQRAFEIMDKGICAPSCLQEFILSEEIDEELAELERLAEIGRATERAYNHSKRNNIKSETLIILNPNIEVLDCDGCFDSVEELLNLAKEY